MTTSTIPKYLEGERKKSKDDQVRMEAEAARIQTDTQREKNDSRSEKAADRGKDSNESPQDRVSVGRSRPSLLREADNCRVGAGKRIGVDGPRISFNG
jgi:hypothetical protein